MLIYQQCGNSQPDVSTEEDFDWTAAARSYPNIEEAPSFISRQRQVATQHVFTTSASPQNLQGTQLQVYTMVKTHYESNNPTPLYMIISGTAGTGKTYLIHCLRLFLNGKLNVAAPTGVAAFLIDGTTLHTHLALPT